MKKLREVILDHHREKEPELESLWKDVLGPAAEPRKLPPENWLQVFVMSVWRELIWRKAWAVFALIWFGLWAVNQLSVGPIDPAAPATAAGDIWWNGAQRMALVTSLERE